jgi:uncharacterized protein
VVQERQNKDRAFKHPDYSPFNLVKDSFSALKYYDCNSKFLVNAKLEAPDSSYIEIIKATQNEVRKYEVAGILNFTIKDTACKLKAYFEDSTHSKLFIMFKDLTNHSETYGGGRYLDAMYSADGNIVLNFNKAYNPFCHYNHDFSCPVVKGFTLPVRIEAGEKKYW